MEVDDDDPPPADATVPPPLEPSRPARFANNGSLAFGGERGGGDMGGGDAGGGGEGGGGIAETASVTLACSSATTRCTRCAGTGFSLFAASAECQQAADLH